jgi:hypothetical protein
VCTHKYLRRRQPRLHRVLYASSSTMPLSLLRSHYAQTSPLCVVLPPSRWFHVSIKVTTSSATTQPDFSAHFCHQNSDSSPSSLYTTFITLLAGFTQRGHRLCQSMHGLPTRQDPSPRLLEIRCHRRALSPFCSPTRGRAGEVIFTKFTFNFGLFKLSNIFNIIANR